MTTQTSNFKAIANERLETTSGGCRLPNPSRPTWPNIYARNPRPIIPHGGDEGLFPSHLIPGP